MLSTQKAVLLLGVNVNPGEPISQETLVNMIKSDFVEGKKHNLDMQYFMTDLGNPDYDGIKNKLQEGTWDFVAVGAGVRCYPERTAFFEFLVNAIVRYAKPAPKLVFNMKPNSVVEAVLRASEIEKNL